MQRHCNHYKDARLRWGVASFFTRRPILKWGGNPEASLWSFFTEREIRSPLSSSACVQRETRSRSRSLQRRSLGHFVVGGSISVGSEDAQRQRFANAAAYTQMRAAAAERTFWQVLVSVMATALVNSELSWKQKALILHAGADRRRAQGRRFLYSCRCSLYSHCEKRRAGRRWSTDQGMASTGTTLALLCSQGCALGHCLATLEPAPHICV